MAGWPKGLPLGYVFAAAELVKNYFYDKVRLAGHGQKQLHEMAALNMFRAAPGV